ncbi:uracil-xanthine permease family protein [Thermophilibacter mediterraneus]|uniref:uracil-xanthine permease family protein n=1 Tax=Thermophilibacter mediterraneus TaxID=1871031 RepID=UPI0009317FB1|nr:solute carrier family 23 protein [Thermophilibacter mediterraneus]
MAKTQTAGVGEAHDYLFQREGMPPVGEMLPCALQHVLASFAGIITPAILIAATFNFTTQQRTDIIQVALILSAIDTALQAFAPFRRIGGNLPIVMGVSFAFLPALQAMGATFSFGSLLGGEIVGGIAAILFGIFYGKLKRFFPPVVTGTVIFTIGVSLYPTAIKYMAGGEGTDLWGTPQAWCVALVTFAVVFGLNNFAKGTLKLGSVFFGMIAGIIVSAPFGMLDFSAVGSAGVFAFPKIMPYAIEFHPEVCITLAVVYPMVAIQVIGDVSAACLGSMDRMPTERELSGAIVSQGCTSLVSAFIGGLPTSALGQNVGIICSNKVVNKWVFVIVAAVFAAAGLLPQLSALLTAIPQPVIGGATVGVFGTITMNGVRMFTKDGLTPRTTTIVGTSVVFGLGIWMATGCLAGPGMPSWVTTVIGSNAITPAALMAILLNLVLPTDPPHEIRAAATKEQAVAKVMPASKE